jgi:plasmid stability protein
VLGVGRSIAASIDTKFVEHYSRVMKNVTITMPEEVARWVRVEAARRGTSVSRMVGELLRESMENALNYRRHHADFNAVPGRSLRTPGEGLPSRDEIHDRAGLR